VSSAKDRPAARGLGTLLRHSSVDIDRWPGHATRPRAAPRAPPPPDSAGGPRQLRVVGGPTPRAAIPSSRKPTRGTSGGQAGALRGQRRGHGCVPRDLEIPQAAFGQLIDLSIASSDRRTAWDNSEQNHSGLGLLTPTDVHYGLAERRVAARASVLAAAHAEPGAIPRWPASPVGASCGGVDQSAQSLSALAHVTGDATPPRPLLTSDLTARV
jgi:hypothetical protein